jgi:murein DD-endopeptidase MepM/ murein hydrolase activator NlpD
MTKVFRRRATVSTSTTVLAFLVGALPATGTHPIDLVQPVHGPITRHFEAPPGPYAAGHRGIDFAAPRGSPVRAAADGVVRFAGRVGANLFLSIEHDGGFITTYSFLDGVLVRKGERVHQDQPVARSGLGHPEESFPHLHFGLRRGDEYLDPEPVLLESIRRNLWRVISLAPT